MKKLAALVVSLLIVLASGAQEPIVVKGKIDNCENRENSYLTKEWFNPQTLQVESKTFDFSIANDGTFRVKFTETDDYYYKYWIFLGRERTQLSLVPGDSIYMTLDAKKFDETIMYSGRGAGKCNYQRDVFLLFFDNSIGTDVANKVEPSEFLKILNFLTDSRMALLDKYLQSGAIDSDYYAVEKRLIYNDRVNHILKHENRFRNHREAPGYVISSFNDLVQSVDLSDERSMQHDLMRDLVNNLPFYVATWILNPGEAKMKTAINWAKAHYPSTMYQYYSKELVRNQLRTTQCATETYALIDFFNKQFDEPAVKRELQLQKSYASGNSFVSSNLFRISVIIITCFLIALGLVFLIVWSIQRSNRNDAKFNLSLWLKVGFYLIAGILVLVIINDAAPFRNLIFVLLLSFLLLGIFLIHTYFLIPQYAINKKWLSYAISLFATISIFLFVFDVIGAVQFSLYQTLVLIEIIFGLALLSWISYYVHQMASGKSTLKNLRQAGYLNLELATHLIVIFLFNLAFVANQNQDTITEQALTFYPFVFLFYFHTFIVYPRFLRKGKLAWFFGVNLAILFGVALITATYDLIQAHEALRRIGIETEIPDLISLRNNIRFDLMVVFALTLIPSFAYYFVRKQLIKNESAGYNLYRKKEAELAQLKAQVNPHFLFNTLNTLYAFALKEGSEKTAECIAKLANLMRFMLDDMEKDTILLEREVSYIQDYVKLQSIRSAVEHDIAINVAIEEGQSYAIAPMLFIPFVENAFKHGMNPNKLSHLKIDITGKGNRVQFVVENSIDNSFEAYYKEKGFGIGIENVKSRLKFIYPNRHNISIAKTNEKFIVILSIDL